ncbi:MAG TPA: class I SAM-dependent methyltransferase [Verrucomicrobiae bacterium]|jgi:2-polyprenyl-3-methyl-5-hydroxy-6-metoxy-1,4-benzoquinol methylase
MNPSDNFLSRNCPICDAQESAPFLRKLELQLVRCVRCAMIYANPVPQEMATGNFYDKAGSEYLTPEKLESDYAPVRFQRELRLFRAHCHRGSVLDVGCSSGGFLYQLKKQFPKDYQTLGTDVSTEPLEYAAKMGVPVVKGEFLTQTFTEKFDAVTFWAVMEHLSEPRLFLEKAASILKPGGHCFILTPNMNSLAVKLIGAKYRYIFPEHLNYFTPATMKRFAELQFKVVGMKSTHFNPLVILKDFRGGQRNISRAERVKLLKRTTGYKQSRWMYPVKKAYQATESILGGFNLADNVAVVGRRSS